MGDTTQVGANMEWLQLYEQSFNQQQGSPSNSSATTTTSPPSSGNQGSTNSFSKPITRRRSRASKKTPTTHLKASATNFRALVQKFTGRPKRSPDGPINLNFKLGRVQSRRGSTNLISLFGGDQQSNSNNNDQDHLRHQQQQNSHPVEWPEQSISNNNNDQDHRRRQEQQNSHQVEWPEKSIGLDDAFCMASTSLRDHEDVNCNNLHVPIGYGDPNYGSPCNYLDMPDDAFFDFPMQFRLLEESFSSEVVNDCFA